MKIFVDTADLDEIQESKKWGIVDGVTTNPSLIKKAVEKFKEEGNKLDIATYIEKICRTVDGPVSLEVKGSSYNEIVREAKILFDRFNHVNNNVVIKIPINTHMKKGDELFDGVKAIKTLHSESIPVNTTLIMSPEQALLAAKAGAEYVSPFLGRIDDYLRQKLNLLSGKMDYYDSTVIKKFEEQKFIVDQEAIQSVYERTANDNYSDNGIYDGIELVSSILQIYKQYNFKTKVIAASIRNTRQVRKVAELGVNIATIPFSVIKDMISHHKTTEGMNKFTEDIVEEYRILFD